jgi:uncharacterized membrane protein YcjF (UPF0283 family)
MLNAEETRKLGEIARVTALSDPAFARRLAAGPLAGKARRRRVLARLLLAPGALLFVAGVIAASTDLIRTSLCVFSIALIIYVAGRCPARRTNR